MVFSSLVFLFLFLPIVSSLYFIFPKSLKNSLLLLSSLFFYAWGEQFFVLAMLVSIFFNYLVGLWITKTKGKGASKAAVGVGILGNLTLLIVYKYANFLVANLNDVLMDLQFEPFRMEPIHLPIGISFFTFQAMSYVIDVYREEASAQKNPLNLALYISLFPQLIAGPIVRYHDIASQLVNRHSRLEDIAHGIRRFIIGLGKKVIIANTLGVPADKIFGLPTGELTPGLAWLAVISYTLQIYFDFSGYSDMAIGLGRMFGFRFLENFEYPYISQSIREFWRRWHISLSTWFRDYLYIPLGGNRYGTFRTYRNLIIVFFLCGLWHGASWTFVVWGLYHGLFLVLERTSFGRTLNHLPRWMRHFYTLSVVVIGWVFFRSETFSQALSFLKAMSGFAPGTGIVQTTALYWNNELILVLFAGIIGSCPILPWFESRLNREYNKKVTTRIRFNQYVLPLMGNLALVGIFFYSVLLLAAKTHNPFIYFRF